MKIYKLITEGKILWPLSNAFNLFFKEIYGNQFGEFASRYLGLKGFKGG